MHRLIATCMHASVLLCKCRSRMSFGQAVPLDRQQKSLRHQQVCCTRQPGCASGPFAGCPGFRVYLIARHTGWPLLQLLLFGCLHSVQLSPADKCRPHP